MPDQRQDAQQKMVAEMMQRPGVAEIVRLYEAIQITSTIRVEQPRVKFATGGNI